MNKRLIEQLNEIPMIDVFAKYDVKWEKGRNFRCPFPAHGATGKTPSGRYYENTNSYGCFGCHKGGGPIHFVMNMEGISFREACNVLMKWKGIEGLPEFSYKRYSERLEKNNNEYLKRIRLEFLAELLSSNELSDDNLKKFSVLFCEQNLLTQDEFKERVLEFSKLSTEEYYVTAVEGFAELVRDNLFIVKEIVTPTPDKMEIIESNKSFRSKRQFSNKDAFSGILSTTGLERWEDEVGRYLFPVFLPGKLPIGFAGRAIEEDLIKYLTRFDFGFRKEDILYGLDLALPSIKENKYVIIVEGILDVLRCRSLGYNNVVAPMSTSLSESHIILLKAITDSFLLCYDGDTGGAASIEIAQKNLDKYRLLYEVVEVPEGHDPDSWGLFDPIGMSKNLRSRWR